MPEHMVLRFTLQRDLPQVFRPTALVLAIPIQDAKRRGMRYKQVYAMRYGIPDDLFVLGLVLKGVPHIIGSVGRAKYFKALYFYHLMFQIDSSFFNLPNQHLFAHLNYITSLHYIYIWQGRPPSV